jgi:hypothetical protein
LRQSRPAPARVASATLRLVTCGRASGLFSTMSNPVLSACTRLPAPTFSLLLLIFLSINLVESNPKETLKNYRSDLLAGG